MVTTFTRRAATELQVRLVERSDAFIDVAKRRGMPIADPKIHELRIGTIHSLCDALLAEFDMNYVESGTQLVDDTEIGVRIARDHRWALGYNSGWPRRVLNRLLDNPALTMVFRPAWDDNGNWPVSVMERVSCIRAILDQHIETWLPRCAVGNKLNAIEAVHGPKGLTDDLIKLQTRWQDYLDQNNIQDFASVQKRFLERQHLIADHLSHVFVDEFQDNNPIQFAIHTNWLKRFRGSDIECFNQLQPLCAAENVGYRVAKLETNHRSTKNIIGFSKQFHGQSVLKLLSMQKQIDAAVQPRSYIVPIKALSRKSPLSTVISRNVYWAQWTDQPCSIDGIPK
jgi:DNA helicase-2/ATP-dependent DNA helicase PcrA